MSDAESSRAAHNMGVAKNAIILVVDRLHVGYLGCYGNTWLETPAINRLAAEGFLFDQALINSPELHATYRSWWTGAQPLEPVREGASESLPALLSQVGIECTLLTDTEDVAAQPSAADFDDVIRLPLPDVSEPASDIDDTQLARVAASIVEWLEDAQQPFLLWVHTQGLAHAFDAPLAMRNTYVDHGEAEPPSGTEVPRLMLDDDTDPDEVLGIRRAYGAQVQLLDECLAGLQLALSELGLAQNTLLILVSPRGMPLGEHRCLGPLDNALYSELVHVPWIMRFPDRWGETGRSSALVQPTDLFATLLDWWQVQAESQLQDTSAHSVLPLIDERQSELRDRILLDNGTAQAIRIPSWYQIEHREASDLATRVELYAKPDDRWEMNEVANRASDVDELFRSITGQSARWLAADQASRRSSPLAPLDPSLDDPSSER